MFSFYFHSSLVSYTVLLGRKLDIESKREDYYGTRKKLKLLSTQNLLKKLSNFQHWLKL